MRKVFPLYTVDYYYFNSLHLTFSSIIITHDLGQGLFQSPGKFPQCCAHFLSLHPLVLYLYPQHSLGSNWAIGTGTTICAGISLPPGKGDNTHRSFSKQQSWKITTDGGKSCYTRWAISLSHFKSTWVSHSSSPRDYHLQIVANLEVF